MNPMPTNVWQCIAMLAISIVIAFVAWYARTTREDLKELKAAHEKLNERVLANTHSKDEVNQITEAVRVELKEAKAEIMDSIKDLHKRFDTVLTHLKV